MLREEFVKWAFRVCDDEKIILRLVNPRKRRLGDFSIHPLLRKPKITLNNNLPPDLFILTFLHELAHKRAHDLYKGKVAPHGKEWKKIFSYLLDQAVSDPLFIEHSRFLLSHQIQPKARINIDKEDTESTRVKDLPVLSTFKIKGSSQEFILKKKIRTRYLCESKLNGKLYTVSGNAIVIDSI